MEGLAIVQHKLDEASLRTRAQAIRLAVFDVDGVLTDGGLLFDSEGRESKRFHAHDGMGFKRLLAAGVGVAVITARSSEVVRMRMAELGIEHVYQGAKNKLACLSELCERLQIALSEVCYTGDDEPDVGCMQNVGLACTVADATPAALQVAHWVSERKGGQGAARQVCELLIGAVERGAAG